MSIQLIVDSCCDLTKELKEKLKPDVAPLKVKVVGGQEYIDDGTVDITALINDMAASKQGAISACPSTDDYAKYMRMCDECFVVTLSSKLSGSYNAARVAAENVLEEEPHKKIHVFDSESASAGEVQIPFFYPKKLKKDFLLKKLYRLPKAILLPCIRCSYWRTSEILSKTAV